MLQGSTGGSAAASTTAREHCGYLVQKLWTRTICGQQTKKRLHLARKSDTVGTEAIADGLLTTGISPETGQPIKGEGPGREIHGRGAETKPQWLGRLSRYSRISRRSRGGLSPAADEPSASLGLTRSVRGEEVGSRLQYSFWLRDGNRRRHIGISRYENAGICREFRLGARRPY